MEPCATRHNRKSRCGPRPDECRVVAGGPACDVAKKARVCWRATGRCGNHSGIRGARSAASSWTRRSASTTAATASTGAAAFHGLRPLPRHSRAQCVVLTQARHHPPASAKTRDLLVLVLPTWQTHWTNSSLTPSPASVPPGTLRATPGTAFSSSPTGSPSSPPTSPSEVRQWARRRRRSSSSSGRPPPRPRLESGARARARASSGRGRARPGPPHHAPAPGRPRPPRSPRAGPLPSRGQRRRPVWARAMRLAVPEAPRHRRTCTRHGRPAPAAPAAA